jgi:hypothetical protein
MRFQSYLALNPPRSHLRPFHGMRLYARMQARKQAAAHGKMSAVEV